VGGEAAVDGVVERQATYIGDCGSGSLSDQWMRRGGHWHLLLKHLARVLPMTNGWPDWNSKVPACRIYPCITHHEDNNLV
jgi:hypothetical protein